MVDPVTDPNEDAFYSHPIVTDETAFIGGDGSLYAYSITDGSLRWSKEIVGPEFRWFQAPATDDSLLFWTGKAVYGLDPADGSTQWNYTFDDLTRLGTTVANGAFYGIQVNQETRGHDLVRKYAPV